MSSSLPFAFAKSNLSAVTIDAISPSKIHEDDLLICINRDRIKCLDNNPLIHPETIDFSTHDSLITLGKFNNNRILIHFQESTITESEQGEWLNIRVVAMNQPAEIASLCAHASAIAHWHNHHKFCGLCGSDTNIGKEHSRTCQNTECNHHQFPRVDPAVIMSVINEKDEMLLGRQASWDEKRFSVVAGFLSHGETLEECVAREVKEETGIIVDSVEYIASQPWPFPSSIMLGFKATAKKQAITTVDDELEEAMWISREELQRKRELKQIFISPKLSISRYLIDLWIENK